MWGSFPFYTKSSDLLILFFGTVLKLAYTCWHTLLPHSLLHPVGKFRLRRQKSSGKYRNWRKTICLPTHATEFFLGIYCVYKMVSHHHMYNLCLSENQIRFYKEITLTKISFSQILPDLFFLKKEKPNQAMFKNWTVPHQAFNHS